MNRYFFISIVLLSSQLAAQTDSVQVLNEVIVTANRFAQKQNNTGKVVTVITQKEIQSSPYTSLAEILNRQAGMSILGSNNSPGTNMDIYMRGAATGNTLILVDGNPAFDPSTIRATFDINLIPLGNIERIEILKGGQSTVYGSDAVAGVINIITNQQHAGNHSAVEVSTASFGTRSIQATTKGSNKLVRYALGYYQMKSTGFSSAIDSTKKDNFDKDGMKEHAANIWIGAPQGKSWNWHLAGNWSNYKNDLDQTSYEDAKDFTVRNNNLRFNGGVSKKWSLGEMHVNYHINKTSRNYLDDSLYQNGFTDFMQSDYKGNSSFAEWYGNFKLHKYLTLFTSADYRWQHTDQSYFSKSAYGDYSSALSSDSAKINISSLSASLIYNGEKGFNIEAGGRINIHSMYGNNITYTFNPSYLYKNTFKFAFNLSSAFKAPTLYQLYDGFSGQPNLKPETSTTAEFAISYIGTKNMIARVVGFKRNTLNGIDYDYTQYKYYNYNSKKENGIELELGYQQKKWNASINYTYVNGQLNAQNFAYNPTTYGYDVKGDTTYPYLTRIPKNTLNISAGYQISEKFQIAIFHKLLDKRFEPQYMSAPIEMPGFQLTDIHLQYVLRKNITLNAGLKNIFNKQYQEVYGYATRGRNYIISFRLKL